MNKKGEHHALAVSALVGIVAVLGLVLLFKGGSEISGAAILDDAEPGTCVIGPNSGSNANKQGTGEIQNGKSVCDAQINGCGACVQHCRDYSMINDKFGCPLDGADGYCNPDLAGTDPDCNVVCPCWPAGSFLAPDMPGVVNVCDKELSVTIMREAVGTVQITRAAAGKIGPLGENGCVEQGGGSPLWVRVIGMSNTETLACRAMIERLSPVPCV